MTRHQRQRSSGTTDLQPSAFSLQPLESILQPSQVVTDPVALLTYEGDAGLDRGVPDGVVFPRSAAEVARIVGWAAAYGVPLIARGAGTGLSGGAVPEHGGIIVQFSHMNRVIEFDTLGRSAVVEPGLVNLTLDTLVKTRGLYYPPDPASGRASTLGGNLAENAGGPHCFKYGVTSNYVTGLEVALVDGRLARFGGRALDYPEYDLNALLVGSEGTLGIITSAEVRLLRNPPAIKTMMAAFDSVEQAGEAVSAVIAEGLVPATMEMMNQQMMRIIEDFAHAGLPVDAGAALIIEADGFPESVGPQIEEIATILRAHGGFNLHIAQSAEERDKIWYGRKSAAGAMARLAPAYYLVDGTVPRSKLAETLRGVNRICEEAGLNVAYVFHAGDGNLHPLIPIPNPRDQALVKKVVAAGRDILALCVGMDGSITGEHGVGIEKRAFMPLMYSNDELDVMREIRDIFDPKGVFNPGKIFPAKEDQEDRETGRHGDRETRRPGDTERWPNQNAGHTAPEDQGTRGNGALVTPAVTPSPAPPVRVTPATTAEAAAMLQAYTAEGRTIRILGAGTKSAGLPPAEVVVATAGMRGIRTYARDDLFVTVGAGTSLAELQAELARDRTWAPMASPWPASTVGGIVATSFNAPLRQRYGGLRDIVLAATIALPDGRTIRAGRPVVKNVAGYDLPKLFVGSFGTLGLITDVTLKLGPLPRARSSLLVPIDDLDQGLNAGARLLPICLNASALLVIRPASRSQGSMTLVYTAEGHPDDIAAEMAQVRAALHDAGITGAEETEEASGTDLWANWLAETGDTTLRIGVGARELPDTLLALQKAGAGKPSFVADLASGLLYLCGVPVADARRAAKAARGYAVALNTVAADGDPWGHTPDGLNLMQTLRNRFGAGGLLNPGAFLV